MPVDAGRRRRRTCRARAAASSTAAGDPPRTSSTPTRRSRCRPSACSAGRSSTPCSTAATATAGRRPAASPPGASSAVQIDSTSSGRGSTSGGSAPTVVMRDIVFRLRTLRAAIAPRRIRPRRRGAARSDRPGRVGQARPGHAAARGRRVLDREVAGAPAGTPRRRLRIRGVRTCRPRRRARRPAAAPARPPRACAAAARRACRDRRACAGRAPPDGGAAPPARCTARRARCGDNGASDPRAASSGRRGRTSRPSAPAAAASRAPSPSLAVGDVERVDARAIARPAPAGARSCRRCPRTRPGSARPAAAPHSSTTICAPASAIANSPSRQACVVAGASSRRASSASGAISDGVSSAPGRSDASRAASASRVTRRGVRAQRDRRGVGDAGGERERLGSRQLGEQQRRQPGGQARGGDQVPGRIDGRVGQRRLALAPEPAQQRVREPRHAAPRDLLARVDGVVDGRVGRHAIEEQDLVRADAQRDQHPRRPACRSPLVASGAARDRCAPRRRSTP